MRHVQRKGAAQVLESGTIAGLQLLHARQHERGKRLLHREGRQCNTWTRRRSWLHSKPLRGGQERAPSLTPTEGSRSSSAVYHGRGPLRKLLCESLASGLLHGCEKTANHSVARLRLRQRCARSASNAYRRARQLHCRLRRRHIRLGTHPLRRLKQLLTRARGACSSKPRTAQLPVNRLPQNFGSHLRTLNVSRFRLSDKHQFFLAVRVATMYPTMVEVSRPIGSP